VYGYVAVTDPGWWQQLVRDPGPKDANFWRPSPRAYRLPIGTPFLFKLKAPHHAIAGFGYFAGFSVLPDWLAWDTFGTGNGVPSLEALRSSLSRIQDGARIAADPGGRIGCCLVAESVFFSRDAWVAAPRDWSPRTQSGMRIDLSHGDGLRIWGECLERMTPPASTGVAEDTAHGQRYGEPVLHTPRLGQGIFRVRVLDAYGRACSVTSEHSLPVLDAAHIRPYGRDYGYMLAVLDSNSSWLLCPASRAQDSPVL
jgi:putative restriction endonuclease